VKTVKKKKVTYYKLPDDSAVATAGGDSLTALLAAAFFVRCSYGEYLRVKKQLKNKDCEAHFEGVEDER
jgi:hypothetical protein